MCVCACVRACACVSGANCSFFANILENSFFVEAAPHRTELLLGAAVARPMQDPSWVLDDILEQLHGAHDILVLHGEWMSGLVRP